MSTPGWGPEHLDPELLHRALSHRSWCAEHPGESSNERLEFLGDAVLGVVVTDHLFSAYPDRSEGWLSPARSSLVRGGTLATIARELGLGEQVLLGKGEESSGGREKASILADVFEAVVGAVYVGQGFDAARAFVLDAMGDRLEAVGTLADPAARTARQDHKSRLQEHCARGGLGAPEYTWIEEGPEHEKSFTVAVSIDGDVVGEGTGRSKKQAEQQAACRALAHIDNAPEPE